MDGKEAFLTFGGEHEQFDLAALDEVDHLVLIAAGIDVSEPRNLDGVRIYGLPLQRIAQLLFELVGLGGLLNHGPVSFGFPL
jgi:hypothetical protein